MSDQMFHTHPNLSSAPGSAAGVGQASVQVPVVCMQPREAAVCCFGACPPPLRSSLAVSSTSGLGLHQGPTGFLLTAQNKCNIIPWQTFTKLLVVLSEVSPFRLRDASI